MKTMAVLLLCTALAGCDPESPFGFRLPDGDPIVGRETFVELRWNACHQVEGVDLPFAGTGASSVTLGGPTTWVKTHGELVTAIINPSHKISRRYAPEEVTVEGQSLMSIVFLNDVMTVRQLTDLVAFLQGSYDVVPPPMKPTHWPVIP